MVDGSTQERWFAAWRFAVRILFLCLFALPLIACGSKYDSYCEQTGQCLATSADDVVEECVRVERDIENRLANAGDVCDDFEEARDDYVKCVGDDELPPCESELCTDEATAYADTLAAIADNGCGDAAGL